MGERGEGSGRGAESWTARELAWSSINHLILSAAHFLCASHYIIPLSAFLLCVQNTLIKKQLLVQESLLTLRPIVYL